MPATSLDLSPIIHRVLSTNYSLFESARIRGITGQELHDLQDEIRISILNDYNNDQDFDQTFISVADTVGLPATEYFFQQFVLEDKVAEWANRYEAGHPGARNEPLPKLEPMQSPRSRASR